MDHNRKIVFFVAASQACVHHNTDAPVIAIKAFERGYYPVYTKAQPDDLNHHKFSSEELEAAIIGSMFGWHVPGARQAIDAIEREEKNITVSEA